MTSGNGDLNIGTYNLSKFTNKFDENFDTYFTYNQTSGDIICKKDGWYGISLSVSLDNWSEGEGDTILTLYINNVGVGFARCVARSVNPDAHDYNLCTLYVKKGDSLKISKVTKNSNISSINDAGVTIIKL